MRKITRAALILLFALCLTSGLCFRAAGWERPSDALAEVLHVTAEPSPRAILPTGEPNRQTTESAAPATDSLTAEPTAEPVPEPTAAPTPEPTPTPLANGARGDDVTAIQNRLSTLGFFTGASDGIFGPLTEQAVKDYQQYTHDLSEPDPAAEPESAAPDEIEAPDVDEVPEAAEPPYEPDGIVSETMKAALLGEADEVYRGDLTRGARGGEVTRLQTRLAALRYYDIAIDGQYGGGTSSAVSYFQKRNGLPETGEADEATQRRLFSEAAVKSDRPDAPFKLIVDVSDQRVYAYRWANGSYSELARTMVCSTGLKATPTPLGTFSAGGPAGRWYYFRKFNCWAQYAYRIDGAILFHSVLYGAKDESTLRRSSVNNLGGRASHGCVRLKVADAKWIYTNCPAGTTVTVRS